MTPPRSKVVRLSSPRARPSSGIHRASAEHFNESHFNEINRSPSRMVRRALIYKRTRFSEFSNALRGRFREWLRWRGSVGSRQRLSFELSGSRRDQFRLESQKGWAMERLSCFRDSRTRDDRFLAPAGRPARTSSRSRRRCVIVATRVAVTTSNRRPAAFRIQTDPYR